MLLELTKRTFPKRICKLVKTMHPRRAIYLAARPFTSGRNPSFHRRCRTLTCITRPVLRLQRFNHVSMMLATKQSRSYATRTPADEVIEQIQEQYSTARDEFEMASEETEGKTIYAADDRAAARKELESLKKMYAAALEGEDADEVKRRVGHRIRELDNAVEALERSALE